MPNSPDAILRENEAEVPAGNPASETSADFQVPTSSTTILDLRRLYGPHFAAGYGDNETLGHLLARSGLNTLDQYLERHHAPPPDKP